MRARGRGRGRERSLIVSVRTCHHNPTGALPRRGPGRAGGAARQRQLRQAALLPGAGPLHRPGPHDLQHLPDAAQLSEGRDGLVNRSGLFRRGVGA